MRRGAALLCAAAAARADPPFVGPYAVAHSKYDVATLDPGYPHAAVVAPVPNGTQKFPLIVYLHGAGGGSFYEDYPEGYKVLFTNLASHGYVIVAPESCDVGCTKGGQGAGWDNFYKEAGVSIAWAKTMGADPVLAQIDWNVGIGVSGHSMGGQGVSKAAEKGYAAANGIKAAVGHHPAPDDGGAAIGIPLAMYTGANDGCCGTDTTHHIWDAAPKPKFLAIKKDAPHTEPVLFKDNGLGLYTAAWFKIYLEGDKGTYYDLIYGNSTDAMCNQYEMAECVRDA